MSARQCHLIVISTAFAALAAASAAHAQVTIHLTTTNQTSCTVTTDAAGLTLVPGTTDLQATGVTLSGSGCGGGSPPQPANFVLNAPSSATVGAAFSVSWSVTGATSCTGIASLNGNSTTLAGWTDVTSTTSPRSVTAPSAGTYTLNLSCSNQSGTVTSQPAAVAVTTGGGGGSDGCPAGRITTSSISYVPSGSPPTRPNVDVTSWDNIWGHATASDSVVAWPGRSNSAPVILNFNKTQYIAAKFHVPANASSTLFGWISHTTYNYGHDLTAAISTQCGNFNPPDVACKGDFVGSQQIVPWRISGSNFCKLTPDTDYFLNIKMTDPSQPSSTCSDSATQCAVGTLNNIGGL